MAAPTASRDAPIHRLSATPPLAFTQRHSPAPQQRRLTCSLDLPLPLSPHSHVPALPTTDTPSRLPPSPPTSLTARTRRQQSPPVLHLFPTLRRAQHASLNHKALHEKALPRAQHAPFTHRTTQAVLCGERTRATMESRDHAEELYDPRPYEDEHERGLYDLEPDEHDHGLYDLELDEHEHEHGLYDLKLDEHEHGLYDLEPDEHEHGLYDLERYEDKHDHAEELHDLEDEQDHAEELHDLELYDSVPPETDASVAEPPHAEAQDTLSVEDDDDAAPRPSQKTRRTQERAKIQLPEAEITAWTLPNGVEIKRGLTVELKDRSRNSNGLHSGDFLRVLQVIRNQETDKVKLRGHRLRRTKYLAPLWSAERNELVLVLHVDEHETASPFIGGEVDVSTAEVLRTRDVVMTNRTYPSLSFRRSGMRLPGHIRTRPDAQEWIFHNGPLVCRAVNVLHLNKNGKAYSGEVRRLTSREVDAEHAAPPEQSDAGHCSETAIEIDDGDNSERDFVFADNRKRRSMPAKTTRYTYGDVFCGAGGSSQGAKQAGLTVRWGLDKDDGALKAYCDNHAGALPFNCDAHEFPPESAASKELGVDVLHLSPPCCYWSPVHTREGQNDQANYESILTVGPILKRVNPRVATLEQTFGLATSERHRNNFLLLMGDIVDAGYDLRHKIVNMADYGLPQQRKRLLIIAARVGTPLPPFPRPTHGAPDSGLKRFVSVAAALEPLERLGGRASGDQHHQLQTMKPVTKEPYDPRSTMLKGCITTSGGDDNYHYSGRRRFTPRELGLFQSFPIDYKFAEGKGEAIKQIGNAFPPIMAEAMYRTVAKTLEAFDHQLVDAEDIIDDIDALLEAKGVVIPVAPQSPYRYLTRNDGPVRSKDSGPSSTFGRREIAPEETDRRKRGAATIPLRLSSQRRRVMTDAEIAEENGELVVLD